MRTGADLHSFVSRPLLLSIYFSDQSMLRRRKKPREPRYFRRALRAARVPGQQPPRMRDFLQRLLSGRLRDDRTHFANVVPRKGSCWAQQIKRRLLPQALFVFLALVF